jgi:hypothetical protein
VEGCCEHGNEPSGSINDGKFLSSCATGGFSRRAQLRGVVSYRPNDGHLDAETEETKPVTDYLYYLYYLFNRIFGCATRIDGNILDLSSEGPEATSS